MSRLRWIPFSTYRSILHVFPFRIQKLISNTLVFETLLSAYQGHCQVNAKSCTFVQQREDYRGFWDFTSPCIFAIPTPSAFLKGKASGSDFSLT